MFDLSCTSVIEHEKWMVCVMNRVNQGSLNNIFFFSLSDKYFLHIKICRCGIFHLNSIHAQYKLLCLIILETILENVNPDTSLSASLEVD